MADEQPKTSEANVIETRESKDGIREIYTNFVEIAWGLHDVRLRISRVLPVGNGYNQATPLRSVVEEHTAVTMAWAQAKLLRDALTDAIERYELVNGEIKWPKLAAQNAQEDRNARAKQLLTMPTPGCGEAN
ncbi:MAG: DUF3467 domain-containing protein [Candidatus Sulfotelmatobacter sp.]